MIITDSRLSQDKDSDSEAEDNDSDVEQSEGKRPRRSTANYERLPAKSTSYRSVPAKKKATRVKSAAQGSQRSQRSVSADRDIIFGKTQHIPLIVGNTYVKMESINLDELHVHFTPFVITSRTLKFLLDSGLKIVQCWSTAHTGILILRNKM